MQAYITSHYSYLTLLEFDMIGQQISFAKSRYTQSNCLSIAQVLWHIYSIVDGNLYAIYKEMLNLVELHRIQKKCNVKNNKMKKLGNMIFFV